MSMDKGEPNVINPTGQIDLDSQEEEETLFEEETTQSSHNAQTFHDFD